MKFASYFNLLKIPLNDFSGAKKIRERYSVTFVVYSRDIFTIKACAYADSENQKAKETSRYFNSRLCRLSGVISVLAAA